MKRNLLLSIFLITGIFLFSGCGYTYKSGPKKINTTEQKEYPVFSQAKSTLEKAIKTTDETGEKFWFQGWIVTKVQKRRTTSMYNGTFQRDKGYLVNARVLGQPFRYYSSGSEAFINEGEKWVKAPASSKPLDPFSGFKILLPYTEGAKQLPDQKVLGRNCTVLELTLTGPEVAKILEETAFVKTTELQQFLMNQLTMKYLIWIGKDDNYIYQLKTDAWMPAPQAGTMHQEVYFRFWDYNSDSITITEPENIRKYMQD